MTSQHRQRSLGRQLPDDAYPMKHIMGDLIFGLAEGLVIIVFVLSTQVDKAAHPLVYRSTHYNIHCFYKQA